MQSNKFVKSKRRVVSTRVGRKRTKTLPNGAPIVESHLSVNHLKQKQQEQQYKLRAEYLKQIKKLQIQYPEYKRNKILEIQDHLYILESKRSNLYSLQLLLLLDYQQKNLKEQLDYFEQDKDLEWLNNLESTLNLTKPNSNEVDKIDEIGQDDSNDAKFTKLCTLPELQYLLKMNSCVYSFVQNLYKTPLWNEDIIVNTSEMEIPIHDHSKLSLTEICPEHQTRLVYSIEDGTLSCTHCGFTNICIDTTTNETNMDNQEDSNLNKENVQIFKILRLFEYNDEEMNDLLDAIKVKNLDVFYKKYNLTGQNIQNNIDSNTNDIDEEDNFEGETDSANIDSNPPNLSHSCSSASALVEVHGTKKLPDLYEAVEFCQKYIKEHCTRNMGYNLIYVSDVVDILKTNKSLSVRFSPCHLVIASILNGHRIPHMTKEEKNLFERLFLMIREPLQILKPEKTNFHPTFSFIRSCQILAVKHHKKFLRFIPWIEKLTHKDRLLRQEFYWIQISQFAGLPIIQGQDVLLDKTIKIFRQRYKITSATDDIVTT